MAGLRRHAPAGTPIHAHPPIFTALAISEAPEPFGLEAADLARMRYSACGLVDAGGLRLGDPLAGAPAVGFPPENNHAVHGHSTYARREPAPVRAPRARFGAWVMQRACSPWHADIPVQRGGTCIMAATFPVAAAPALGPR